MSEYTGQCPSCSYYVTWDHKCDWCGWEKKKRKVKMKRNSEFAIHMLNNSGKEKAGKIRDAFDACLNELGEVCQTDGRTFSIVRTKLEEACFFAKKSMAIDLGNQDFNEQAS